MINSEEEAIKKHHYITGILLIFVLFLCFSVYRYFEIKKQRLNNSTLSELPNEYSDKGEIIRDHLVNKENIPPPIIQTSPDSDRSECSKPPLVTEKVRTKFSGYVLEYPCTASSSGSIRTYYDEEGNSESIYKLYLGVTFNEDGSIWKKLHNDYTSGKPSFRVILNANGRPVFQTPLTMQRDQMKKAYDGQINGLTLYRDFNQIAGFLDGEKDASGHAPAISCQAGEKIAVEDVFSLLIRPSSLKTYCSASWALTKNIHLYMSPGTIKSKDAYHFMDIYKTIHQGVRNAIISTPSTETKLQE